ncbi:unnamed protein product [Amoebophrya sp. A25]|nr:unnamed protein product [Amoebophrya sp. A25]|eukprot:GSA25T00002149001.1
MPMARKERTHQTGASNRATGWKPIKGVPTDFDGTMRSTLPREYSYHLSRNAPLMQQSREANTDFEQTLAGCDYRRGETLTDTQIEVLNQTRDLKKTIEQAEADAKKPPEPEIIMAPRLASVKAQPARLPGEKVDKSLPSLQVGHHVLPGTVQSLPRWNARSWWEPLKIETVSNIKGEGEITWNSMDSHFLKRRKGQDFLFRTTRTQAEADQEDREAEQRDLNRLEEYYPRRELVDSVKRIEPGNDTQVRPVYLPDLAYHVPSKTNAEMKARVERLRGVLRQKYGGRPGLNKVFRAFAATKPSFLLPKDLHFVLDKMGIVADMRECELLIQAVDRTEKGAITCEEFSDLIFSPLIEIGRGAEDAVERHTAAITQNILDMLVERGQYLGKAFCDVDPDRNYLISKEQFATALGTACNHLSEQAIEFLWAAQFPVSGNNDDPNTMSRLVESVNPAKTASASPVKLPAKPEASSPIPAGASTGTVGLIPGPEVQELGQSSPSRLPALDLSASGGRKASGSPPRPGTTAVGVRVGSPAGGSPVGSPAPAVNTQAELPTSEPPGAPYGFLPGSGSRVQVVSPAQDAERLTMDFTKQTVALSKEERIKQAKLDSKRRAIVKGERVPADPYKNKIDWTMFMKLLTDYVMSLRPLTPVYYQGKKRHYDLLQRTVALTGGAVPDLDLNRPGMDPETKIQIVADRMVTKEPKLAYMPSEVAMQTVNYNEAIRVKAYAARRAIYHNISKERFAYLANTYEQIPRQDFIKIVHAEVLRPGSQRPYLRPGGSLPPDYVSPRPDMDEIERVRDPEHVAEFAKAVYGPSVLEPKTRGKGQHIQCELADVEAWVGAEFGNKDDMIAPHRAWNIIEKQNEDALSRVDDTRDGLNRALRQLRPMRQRPRDSTMTEEERKAAEEEDTGKAKTSASSTQDRRREKEMETMVYQEDMPPEPAYKNYWQARYMMELVSDGLEKMENGASGKLRSYKAFKRLDKDNDNYITLTDLDATLKQFKIPATAEDLHALFSELDTSDRGSVDIGQFSRRFRTFQGGLLDNMQRPVAAVAFDGSAPLKIGPLAERERMEAARRGHGIQQLTDMYTSTAPAGGEIAADAAAGYATEAADGAEMPLGASSSSGKASASGRAVVEEGDVAGVSASAPAAVPAGVMAPPEDIPATPHEIDEPMSPGYEQMIHPDDDLESRAGDYRMKPYRGILGEKRTYGSVTQVIKARTDRWKPKKHELYTRLPPGRFQRTLYPDTRGTIEPIPDKSIASYMPDEQRFKTMSLAHSIYAAPDSEIPARFDRLKSMAIREFRVNRLQNRIAEIGKRKELAEEAAREFEEKRIARKALNLMNYERKIRATA